MARFRAAGIPAEDRGGVGGGERLGLEGERELVTELMPPDPGGVVAIQPVHLSADGRAYVYSYKRVLDQLYILDGLNPERILIASECIGDGRFFLDRASTYANERVVFGRPIGQNQGVQFPLAKAHIQLEAADLMRWKAADLFENATLPPPGAGLRLASSSAKPVTLRPTKGRSEVSTAYSTIPTSLRRSSSAFCCENFGCCSRTGAY